MTADDAHWLADRAKAGQAISDLRDAHLAGLEDPNFQTAKLNLANAEGRLDLHGQNPDPAIGPTWRAMSRRARHPDGNPASSGSTPPRAP